MPPRTTCIDTKLPFIQPASRKLAHRCQQMQLNPTSRAYYCRRPQRFFTLPTGQAKLAAHVMAHLHFDVLERHHRFDLGVVHTILHSGSTPCCLS